MAIRIVSRKEGFRRCGIAHSANPVTYPNRKFTKAQLKALKAEPMLIVDEIPDPPKKTITGNLDQEQLAGMTVKDLENLATEMNLAVPDRATKAELVKLISAAQVNTNADGGDGK